MIPEPMTLCIGMLQICLSSYVWQMHSNMSFLEAMMYSTEYHTCKLLASPLLQSW